MICADTAHLNVDECGAPEAIAGVKLLTVPGVDGKLTPEAVESRIARVGDEHAVQPRVVSISQCTELGTLYTHEELRELAAWRTSTGCCCTSTGRASQRGRRARSIARGGRRRGGLISFGGTKNGLLGAEAVVLRSSDVANEFAVHPQAVAAAGLEDAVPRRPVRCAADR